MIRCSECDGLCCRHIQSKAFYHCEARPEKLWLKEPKTHPRWCPKYKEGKKNDETVLHGIRNYSDLDPGDLGAIRQIYGPRVLGNRP